MVASQTNKKQSMWGWHCIATSLFRVASRSSETFWKNNKLAVDEGPKIINVVWYLQQKIEKTISLQNWKQWAKKMLKVTGQKIEKSMWGRWHWSHCATRRCMMASESLDLEKAPCKLQWQKIVNVEEATLGELVVACAIASATTHHLKCRMAFGFCVWRWSQKMCDGKHPCNTGFKPLTNNL